MSVVHSAIRLLCMIKKRSKCRRFPCLMVAIDGLGGAGKSTLAQTLCQHRSDIAIVSVDDFYRPINIACSRRFGVAESYERYFEWERLNDQVLHPLSLGRAARYQRYDWVTDTPADWHTVTPTGVVVVEGVYSARPELCDYFDIVVMVETEREECLRRQRFRWDNYEGWLDHWRAVEDWYLTNLNPSDRADLIVSGE